MQTFNIITLIFVLFALASADQSNVRRQLKATNGKGNKDPAATKAPKAPKATKNPSSTKAPKSSKSPSSTKAPKATKATKAPKASTKAPTAADPTPPPPTSGVASLEVSSAIASVVSALVWFAM
jgi:hypothetical protein